MSTTETVATPPESPTPAATEQHAVADRVKNGLVVVRRRIDAAEGQLRAVPTQIRESIDRLLRQARERVRTSLNLPSQAEIEALIARVEELDRKLAALTTPAVVDAPAGEAEGKGKPAKKKQNGR